MGDSGVSFVGASREGSGSSGSDAPTKISGYAALEVAREDGASGSGL